MISLRNPHATSNDTALTKAADRTRLDFSERGNVDFRHERYETLAAREDDVVFEQVEASEVEIFRDCEGDADS